MSNKGIKQSFLTVAFVLGFHVVFGQLVEQPFQPINPKSTKGKSTARIQDYPPLSLPFWDDFSFGYRDSLWMHSGSAIVSDGMGILPPTINVASFNGLKADGTPYDPNDNLANGYNDVLTSQLIKMTEVPDPERGTVYFSFFYQWRGKGEAPDPKDYLVVEFLDADSTWIEIDRIFTDGSLSESVFYPKIYPVTAPYFHDEFQFRFRNHGRVSGPYDVWNIDYVFLAKGRNATDVDFPDQAVTSKLSPLFGSYNAIPIKHFFNTKPLEAPAFGFYNLRLGLPEPLAYRVDGTFTQYFKEAPTITNHVLLRKGIPINAIPSLTHIQETIETLPDPDDPIQFDPDADSIYVTLKTSVYTGDVVDSLGATAIDYLPRYIPTDFRVNDTISTDYVLSNYYAYDDGVAEYSVVLTNEGNQLAYQFDMLTDEVDTLIGFYAYFPFYGGPQSILDVFVLADDGGMPGGILASKENVSIQKNGENKFMWISIQPTLVSGTFYIGWIAPPTKTHVGLDKNNDTGNKIFENSNGFWLQNTVVTGSLMIRPIFGEGDVVTDIEDFHKPVTLYPNPNNGSFHFDKESKITTIHDVTGREISFNTEINDSNQFVTLLNPSRGIYIVRSIRNGKITAQKIVVY